MLFSFFDNTHTLKLLVFREGQDLSASATATQLITHKSSGSENVDLTNKGVGNHSFRDVEEGSALHCAQQDWILMKWGFPIISMFDNVPIFLCCHVSVLFRSCSVPVPFLAVAHRVLVVGLFIRYHCVHCLVGSGPPVPSEFPLQMN